MLCVTTLYVGLSSMAWSKRPGLRPCMLPCGMHKPNPVCCLFWLGILHVGEFWEIKPFNLHGWSLLLGWGIHHGVLSVVHWQFGKVHWEPELAVREMKTTASKINENSLGRYREWNCDVRRHEKHNAFLVQRRRKFRTLKDAVRFCLHYHTCNHKEMVKACCVIICHNRSHDCRGERLTNGVSFSACKQHRSLS